MATKSFVLLLLLVNFSLSLQFSIRAFNSKLEITQSEVFVGTASGVSVSETDGLTWTAVDVSAGGVSAVFGFDNGTVYIGGTNGVYKKTSDNSTWKNIPADVPIQKVRSLYVSQDEKEIYAGTEYGYGNLRYSHDGGKVWGAKPIGKHTSFILGLAEEDGVLYAIASDAGLYKSENRGDTWKLVYTNPSNIAYYYALSVSDGKIYLGTDNGLYISKDKGATFSVASSGDIGSDIITSVIARKVNGESTDTIYAAGQSGLYISKDGSKWVNNNNILAISDLYVKADGTIYAATFASGLAISSDAIIWLYITTDDGLPTNAIKVVYARDRHIED